LEPPESVASSQATLRSSERTEERRGRRKATMANQGKIARKH
jgi:hypothetical protein